MAESEYTPQEIDEWRLEQDIKRLVEGGVIAWLPCSLSGGERKKNEAGFDPCPGGWMKKRKGNSA